MIKKATITWIFSLPNLWISLLDLPGTILGWPNSHFGMVKPTAVDLMTRLYLIRRRVIASLKYYLLTERYFSTTCQTRNSIVHTRQKMSKLQSSTSIEEVKPVEIARPRVRGVDLLRDPLLNKVRRFIIN